ncbi:MAG TPA: hypothetical protein PKD09_08440 [Aggregatilinea sp.]|uniref:alpha/beta hydrolase family protein n=1 Tax=Aggregatilinea sp. TaxID=2806333 RepID=UPI002C8935A6|nr:hypothetical protein [Aggregatilinea sp.]HML21660.1 hypothetical protein [Aggregatilinea sp.]
MKRMLVVVVLLALMLPAAASAQSGDVTYPDPSGSFGVGRLSLYVKDDARDETLTDDPGDRRELMLTVWYPADPDPGAQPAPWLDDDLAAGVVALFGLDPAVLDRVHVHALSGVPVSDAEATYPVLIMLHGGDSSHAVLYTAFAEDLASHGYVVVGITHTYNALITVLPDGRALPMLEQASPLYNLAGADAPLYDQMVGSWDQAQTVLELTTGDALFVLDQLAEIDASDPALGGRLDLDRIGMFGHSFGGATAVEAMSRDGRIKAAADLDGSLWATDYGSAIGPLLFLCEESMPVTEPVLVPPDEELAALGLTPEQAELLLGQFDAAYTAYTNAETAYSVTIAGTEHLNFGDSSLLSGLLADVADQLGPIDSVRALRITDDYLLAFFDTYLDGEPGDLLNGPSPYPEVTFESHAPEG